MELVTTDGVTRRVFTARERVIFRPEGLGDVLTGVVDYQIEPDEQYPNGGEYALTLDDGTTALAFWTELTLPRVAQVATYYALLESLPSIPDEVMAAGDAMPHDEARRRIDARQEEQCQVADAIFAAHMVRNDEIESVRVGRPVFNGCTTTYLRERYGAERVRHVMGVGWFLNLPTEPAVEGAA